jgi:hypothetical protein
MFRYLIECLQYKKRTDPTTPSHLTSLHLTPPDFTSLPLCISPALCGLCTCVIASLVVTQRSHANASILSLALLLRQITSSPHNPSPYHRHNQHTSSPSNPIPNQTDNLNRDLPTSSSLDPAPLSRAADGYQSLQLPPHCTHPDRPRCARLLLLRPEVHVSSRWKGGTRGKERASSIAREISHRNLALCITVCISLRLTLRLASLVARHSTRSFHLLIWVFELSTQSWLPSTSDSSASQSSPVTARTTHSTIPNRLARATKCARLDRVHPLQEGAASSHHVT